MLRISLGAALLFALLTPLTMTACGPPVVESLNAQVAKPDCTMYVKPHQQRCKAGAVASGYSNDGESDRYCACAVQTYFAQNSCESIKASEEPAVSGDGAQNATPVAPQASPYDTLFPGCL
ncbi:MAG: hypothetical protein AUK47_16245 [Deltaproteobacteria bacterium CG2_30_63_29]|nr:MAG: hypothetical protein AUK47_16245 [Deltaproteobacteria bacterium CG2_30_63_29]